METAPQLLIVDDNPDNVELVADIALTRRYRVITANDGFRALQLAHAEHPDLILLDVSMPEMSGFEVCAAIKTHDDLMHIPVIMLTALGDEEDRVRGLNTGADDYLTKPFSPRELLARVEKQLRAKSENESLRQAQQVIRNTFERFVSPVVVEQLLDDPTRVQLGGRLQTVTVMFTDLESFTTISEATEPEPLLNILNTYHALIVRLIQAEGGTIDKFIGDAVMALFNTPLEQPDHALRAVRAALAIREALPAFHQQFDLEHRLAVNIGIHTGQAVVGNVGAPSIMDFTAVGDTVNIAARLEGWAQGGQILTTQAVYDLVKDRVHTTAMGAKALKGRSGTVMTYEVEALLPASVR